MRLQATAKSATGFTKHYIGTFNDSGQPEKIAAIDGIALLEISETEDGVFLFYLNERGECAADSWHESITDAKEQARLEFSVEENDWKWPLSTITCQPRRSGARPPESGRWPELDHPR